jgi:outer membrane receptor protein involved in Fe transport
MLKAYADVQVTSQLTANAGVTGTSQLIARGNENNLHQPDGTYYLGPGHSPGYAVVHVGVRYQVHPRIQLFVQVNNLFDRRYYTGVQLGPTGFTGSGSFVARPFASIDGEFPIQHATFYAPGAPRAAWAGLRIRF